jgi:hypothetical protein
VGLPLRWGFTGRVRPMDRVMSQTRSPFELDQRAETGALTARGGVPLLIEAFRTSGAAAVLDADM